MSDNISDYEDELTRKFDKVDSDDSIADAVFKTRPRIPPGEYELKFLYHEYMQMKTGPKLVLNFVVSSGDHSGVEVPCFYNVDKVDDKGRPQVAHGRRFRKEVLRLFPNRNLRYFAFKWFKEVIVKARIEDTGESGDEWSKVGELLSARRK